MGKNGPNPQKPNLVRVVTYQEQKKSGSKGQYGESKDKEVTLGFGERGLESRVGGHQIWNQIRKTQTAREKRDQKLGEASVPRSFVVREGKKSGEKLRIYSKGGGGVIDCKKALE